MEKHRTTYVPTGVCSKLFIIDTEGDVIQKVQVVGGCDGNLQAISMLLVGMKVTDAIGKLEGIDCHQKGTSCPDQLAQALRTVPVA